MVEVVNRYKAPVDVYIGRGTKWGNLTRKVDENDRNRVIEAYRVQLWGQIRRGEITIQDLLDLDGMSLGCSCKPKACHGDVIVAAVKWAKSLEDHK